MAWRHVASRYNVLVPLERKRTLACNGMSGALADWDRSDTEAFERYVEMGSAEPSDSAFEELLRGGFLVGSKVDELAILQQQ